LIIVLTYLLNISYSLLLNRVKNIVRFIYIQHIGDIFLISSVLFITGGVMSPFSFLYSVSILSAAILLQVRGGILAASFASIFYGSLITLQLYQIITPLGAYDYSEVLEISFYRVVSNIIGFFLIGVLSGYLSEKLKKVDDELEANKQNLLRLQELHGNVIRSIDVGLIITDSAGKVITVNNFAYNILGIEKNIDEGTDINEVISLDEIPEILNSLKSNKLLHERLDVEHIKGNQEKINLDVNFSFWKTEQEMVNGLVIILQDITKEKKMEKTIKLHEKLAAVGKLAAGLAHEIRNPLASMSGSIQMLNAEAKKVDEKHDKLYQIINREAGRLNTIVTQFLEYASPVPPEFKEVDVKVFFEDFLQLLEKDERFRAIEIKLETPYEVLYSFDEKSLKQILWNIAVNAMESIKEAGRKKGLIHWRVEKKGESLVIYLRDNGKGISDALYKNIFTPFYTTKSNGTGLGLALVYNLVQEHNGTITINRDLPEGVEFKIEINTNALSLRDISSIQSS
ncbi:MAG: GHKL domain-containing protein, partial [Nitrospinae bacterium]|nr:GHKL domain-containing protein [Nitrospinota bacterium]